METIIFIVQGSEPEPYTVSFKKNGDNLTAHCTCGAGLHDQWCKHRIRILKGENEGIVSNNVNDVLIVTSWLPGTDVEKALMEVFEAEKKVEEAQKIFKNSKRKLARTLMD